MKLKLRLARVLLIALVTAAAACAYGALSPRLRVIQVPVGDATLAASITPTLFGGDWIVLWREPNPRFGDLVYCPDLSVPRRTVIARVFGLRNDIVDLDGPHIIVNGHISQNVGDCDSFAVNEPQSSNQVRQRCTIEKLNDLELERGDWFSAARRHADSTARHFLPMTVLPNRLYLVSDNRQFPLDSRDFGAVLQQDCQERIALRLWPVVRKLRELSW